MVDKSKHDAYYVIVMAYGICLYLVSRVILVKKRDAIRFEKDSKDEFLLNFIVIEW